MFYNISRATGCHHTVDVGLGYARRRRVPNAVYVEKQNFTYSLNSRVLSSHFSLAFLCSSTWLFRVVLFPLRVSGTRWRMERPDREDCVSIDHVTASSWFHAVFYDFNEKWKWLSMCKQVRLSIKSGYLSKRRGKWITETLTKHNMKRKVYRAQNSFDIHEKTLQMSVCTCLLDNVKYQCG